MLAMIDPVIALAQREDAQRWGQEYVDPLPFVLRHLWYPEYRPLSRPAQFAFFKNVFN